MDDKLKDLTQHLGYTFTQLELLDQALRHRSAGTMHNERLEFLGDAILGLVISAELYKRHPAAKEGDLSRMRSSLVNREVLASLAIELHLNEYLHLGVGERKSGGDKRQSILADTVEAMIGAIYLDGGITACWNCITRWFGEMVDDLSSIKPVKDPKSALQEILQARKLPLPNYECFTCGLAHEQVFRVVCTVAGLSLQTEGTSLSRRKAEQIAAQHFLELLNDE